MSNRGWIPCLWRLPKEHTDIDEEGREWFVLEERFQVIDRKGTVSVADYAYDSKAFYRPGTGDRMRVVAWRPLPVGG